MTRIVTIGGGTGAPTVLQALIRAGFSDINAICAATDSGGQTGVIRSDERDQVIAISDLLRNLLALTPPESSQMDNVGIFREIINFSDGRNRNLGYTIYYALLEKYDNDYLQVQRSLERLLGIQFMGCAIPATSQSATICFQSESGNIYHGEHELDRYSMSQDMIDRVWIEPLVSASPGVIEVIMQATHIVYCPGSMYGSVIANLLPKGVTKALEQTTAKKIFISNLVSVRNETHNFTPEDFWHLFQTYTGLDRPFAVMVVPDLSKAEFENRYTTIAGHYAKYHSYFLGWTAEELRPMQERGVELEMGDHYSLTQQFNRLRHDPLKLAKILQRVIV
ncbi:MAG: YvcK family protein [Anaerolineae bacterium]|nr:YvcK family protein [Anaerolineae bacterium]